MAVAVPQDDWTPAKLRSHHEWRMKMYAPPPPPKRDPLANKIKAVADPEKAAMEIRMCELEGMVASLREQLTAIRRSDSQTNAASEREPVECVAIRLEHIIRVVARYYGLTPQNLKNAQRAQSLVRPRHVAMYLCRELTIKSLPEIGRHLGGRDHTTILHGVRKVEGKMKTDALLCQEIAELEALFA